MASGRVNGVDPRREKLLNFRRRGKSCSSKNCMWCRWGVMHRGGDRLARKRAALIEVEGGEDRG